jgi:hypothetical protein
VVEFQHGELLSLGPLLSPSMGYPMLGDSADSAQQPTVHFNTHPATQPTQFSDFQLSKANCSNESTAALSAIPTVFPHAPTPSTAATPTASAGRIVMAYILSPLPSILKQGTSDANLTYLVQRRIGADTRGGGAVCSRMQPTQLSSVPLRETAGLSHRGEDGTRDVKQQDCHTVVKTGQET